MAPPPKPCTTRDTISQSSPVSGPAARAQAGAQAADAEQRQGDHVEAARAPQVGRAAGQRHGHDVGQQVRVHDPRGARQAGPAAEVGHDRGQGDGHHHQLDAAQEHAQRGDHQHRPGSGRVQPQGRLIAHRSARPSAAMARISATRGYNQRAAAGAQRVADRPRLVGQVAQDGQARGRGRGGGKRGAPPSTAMSRSPAVTSRVSSPAGHGVSSGPQQQADRHRRCAGGAARRSPAPGMATHRPRRWPAPRRVSHTSMAAGRRPTTAAGRRPRTSRAGSPARGTARITSQPAEPRRRSTGEGGGRPSRRPRPAPAPARVANHSSGDSSGVAASAGVVCGSVALGTAAAIEDADDQQQAEADPQLAQGQPGDGAETRHAPAARGIAASP